MKKIKSEIRYLVFICPQGSKCWTLGYRPFVCHGKQRDSLPAIFGKLSLARTFAQNERKNHVCLHKGLPDPTHHMDTYILRVELPAREWDAQALADIKELKLIHRAACKKTNICRNGCISPRKCKRV